MAREHEVGTMTGKPLIESDRVEGTTVYDPAGKNIGEINRLWDEYTKTEMSTEDRALADDFATIFPRFVQEGLRPAVSFLREGKTEDAQRHLIYVLFALSLALEPRMDALLDTQVKHAKESYEHSQVMYTQVKYIAFACIGIGVLLATVVGMFLVRAIVRPLNEAVKAANDIANGDLTKQIHVSTRDETGKLLLAMRHGLPALLLLAFAIASLIFGLISKKNLDAELGDYRLAVVMCLVVYVFLGSTVHFWNATYAWFFFLLGSGVWILDAKPMDGEMAPQARQRHETSRRHASRSRPPPSHPCRVCPRHTSHRDVGANWKLRERHRKPRRGADETLRPASHSRCRGRRPRAGGRRGEAGRQWRGAGR